MEQQSEPWAQAWPSTLHELPEMLAQEPLVQVWVQHSLGLEQDWLTSLHWVEEQWPLVHELEQHSVLAEQASLGPLQNMGVVQTPLVQVPEQHGAPVEVLHEAPEARH